MHIFLESPVPAAAPANLEVFFALGSLVVLPGAFEAVPVDAGALEPSVVLAVAFEVVPVDARAMQHPCW
jgi:hypothetical protein